MKSTCVSNTADKVLVTVNTFTKELDQRQSEVIGELCRKLKLKYFADKDEKTGA
jgi:hypothetical protein